MKDELLVALENRLRIGARRIDPEFQHATGTGERAGNPSLALDLSGIPDIDDHDVVALRSLDGVRGTYGFDLRIGLVEQRLDAAVDGLGHFVFPRLCKSPLLTCPGRGAAFFTMHRGAGTQQKQGLYWPPLCSAPLTRCAASGARTLSYRTSSFIAPSRPSIVIGNMRSENSRRMSVVDSE